MALIQNTADGGTHGVTVTTSNSDGASGTAFSTVSSSNVSFDSGTVRDGLSYRIAPADGSQAWVQMQNGQSTGAAGRAYFLLTGYPTSAIQMFNIRHNNSTVARIAMNTSGTTAVQGSTGSPDPRDMSTPLPLGTWFRFEIFINKSTGEYGAAWFLGDSTIAEDSVTGTGTVWGSNNPSQLTIGKVSSSGNMAPFYVDDIAFQDIPAFIGPAAPTTEPPLVQPAFDAAYFGFATVNRLYFGETQIFGATS